MSPTPPSPASTPLSRQLHVRPLSSRCHSSAGPNWLQEQQSASTESAKPMRAGRHDFAVFRTETDGWPRMFELEGAVKELCEEMVVERTTTLKPRWSKNSDEQCRSPPRRTFKLQPLRHISPTLHRYLPSHREQPSPRSAVVSQLHRFLLVSLPSRRESGLPRRFFRGGRSDFPPPSGNTRVWKKRKGFGRGCRAPRVTSVGTSH